MIPLNPRSVAAVVHDVIAAAAAWVLAFLLRFNFDLVPPYAERMQSTLLWVVPLQAALFLAFGLYRGIWRYASTPDLRRIVLAALGCAAAVFAVVQAAGIPDVPRSVYVLDPLLLIAAMGGSRIAYRGWKESVAAAGDTHAVLVLGAGDAAADLVHNLARSRQWHVVGLLDDNAARHRRQIHGVSVLGPLDSLAEHAQARAVRHAIIALQGAGQAQRRRALAICSAAGVAAMTVPSTEDIVSGRVTLTEIRHVELDDLLGRAPVQLDGAGLSEWLRGHTVLVTGAGGSIGAELCRQIARFDPGRLVLAEQNEFALYRIAEEFGDRHPGLATTALIADVKNAQRMRSVLQTWRPRVVFHAAAYKHVPLMEDLNAWEAVQNNVAGTLCTARAAAAAGVEKFVLVSTDKAVNPTNVMGATKRLAELACACVQDAGTRFVTVRFGNVLGSAGSVVPKFREQIARGGPVTVTHPDIERYFMSIPEAAQLVLQAGLMGAGGEIFVLDMGEPVKIVELARDLIRLSGMSENDIAIRFIGLRPGEKLYEEPLAHGEHTLPTPHPKLRVAKAAGALDDRALAELQAWLALADGGGEAVRAALVRFVPEYRSAGGAGGPQPIPARDPQAGLVRRA